MDEEDPFESSRYLVRFVGEEIDDLEGAIRAFFDEKPYVIVTEFNAQTIKYELKVKGLREMPLAFRGKVSNIIKNLRDALDQIVFSASAFIAGTTSKASHFPFGDDPDDLEDSLSRRKNHRCKGIAPELYEVLRRAEPYPTGDHHTGGNDTLKVLNKVSGPNKHRITLTVAARTSNETLSDGAMNFGAGGGSIFPDERWDRAKNQMILVTYGRGGYVNMNVSASIDIAFNNSFLRDVPVLPFLRTVHGMVGKIVEDTAAEALIIGPRAN